MKRYKHTITASTNPEKYLIESFYQDNFRGLSDSEYADNYDTAIEIAHDYICNSASVSITNMENGEWCGYTYDEYFDGFEGASPFMDAVNDKMWR